MLRLSVAISLAFGLAQGAADEAGILERIGPDRLRVELPEPRASNSARHEVIELVRRH